MNEVVIAEREWNWKKGKSGNPEGRPKGSLNKYSATQLKRLLTVLGHKDEHIIRKMVDIALTDGHPEQGICIKLCVERLIPATKAIEISGLGGKELAVKVLVESVKGLAKTYDSDVLDVEEIKK